MKTRTAEKRTGKKGFTLTELLVVAVVASFVAVGIFTFLGKQRKFTKFQRIRADLESVAQISFFIIGRDIRRAGSNPAGALSFTAGAPIPLAQALPDKIEILADLNADGSIDPDSDEQVTYEFVDDPDNQDGVPDQIRRQAGNDLVIENVRAFDLCYQLASGGWECSPSVSQLALIRKVEVRLLAGTGRVDPNTGKEYTKEVKMNILLRNFR